MTDHWMPSDLCPECGYAVNAASEVGGGKARPVASDVTICIHCAATLEFDPTMVLRACSEETLQELGPEARGHLQRAKQFIKQHGHRARSAEGQARLIKKA